jgi:hypothetical protein
MGTQIFVFVTPHLVIATLGVKGVCWNVHPIVMVDGVRTRRLLKSGECGLYEGAGSHSLQPSSTDGIGKSDFHQMPWRSG